LPNVLESFYGGAAGGGKSEALLIGALMYIETQGYSALLLRRTYKDLSLPGALMDRANQWFRETDAHWDDEKKTWTFPPSMATLTFGYLESEKDKYRYQSSEFQFIGFDELTQFTESQYRYLFSRLRRLKDSPVPLRMRATSNPGGIGHEWVRQRFIVGNHPDRTFIPAKMTDNPHLDQDEYRRSLENLDPITRAQLERGDWDSKVAGTKFRAEWFEIVDSLPVTATKVRYWDLAATEAKKGKDPDYTVGALLGMVTEGGKGGTRPRYTFYITDIRRTRSSPAAVENLIRKTAEMDGKAVPIWMEQEPGASGVNTIAYYARVLLGYNFHGFRNTGSKEVRANPVSSQAEAGNIKLVRGNWIGPFLDEAESFPMGDHDDQVDAVAGAFEHIIPVAQDAVLIYDAMSEVRLDL